MAHRFTVFDSAIGPCAVVWGRRGICGVQLPEGDARATRRRVLERFVGAREGRPTPEISEAVARMVAVLDGEGGDLSTILLDMEGVTSFRRRIYEAARMIPPGQTLSYGEIASRLGVPGAARAVGQALGRNPFPIVVPCHRVLAAGGKPGGFTATGGVATKLRLLALEGAALEGRSEGELTFDARVATAHLRAADPAMRRVIDRVGPFRLGTKATASIFVALAEAIVHQQLSAKAAATIHGRFCALFPRRRPAPRRMGELSDEALRGAGLSRAKVAALRDLADKALARELPTLAEVRRLDDEALVARLTRVRGIGRWSAEMFLIFRLGRPDVLPLDDYALLKGLALALGRAHTTRDDLETRGARWAPYRTVASWYLWQTLELSPT